ncbi:hypothetical protein J3R82DRAFT_10301 [Butyriboletus roseoflavus]|nr:hypothetical protein J3R82DRAFT_10301 [Butyriboletus roseoflavus]
MIHVKWGRDVLHFPIPPLNTPLGKLRADLAAYTQLPVGSFKLVYKGAVMKEDTAPLSTYKLKENATIALIGGHTLAPEKPSASSTPRPLAPKSKTSTPQTEEGTILAIRTELEKVRETLVPGVDAFVRALAPSSGEGGPYVRVRGNVSRVDCTTRADVAGSHPTVRAIVAIPASFGCVAYFGG